MRMPPCQSIAHTLPTAQRTSLLIGAMHPATIPAAMHESPGERGLLMREWRAMAAYCNCQYVKINTNPPPLLPCPTHTCSCCVGQCPQVSGWTSPAAVVHVPSIQLLPVRQPLPLPVMSRPAAAGLFSNYCRSLPYCRV